MNGKNNTLREFGKFQLDAEKRVLWCAGEPLNLPLKQIEMLCVLTEKSGEVVTKDELMKKVWADSFVEESNLSRHIYILRKTFKDFGEARELIQTVPRRGYRFTGEIREIQNGELVIEKHTQTRTLIEIEEEVEKSREDEAQKTRLSKISFSPLLVFSFSIILLGTIAFLAYQYNQAKTSASELKSIAVLPFKAIDAAKENERQGLGLADILITRLSRIKQINVRPTSAVLAYENQVLDSASVGERLKVDAVLEGTIHRAGGRVRVTARLVKVGDNSAIWSGQFEKFASDELKLQDEIALQVVDALALNLSGGERNALTKFYTENADAYQLYQKGRYEWNKRSWAATSEAERLFRNAIEKDPNFALAYVGLADTLVMNIGNTEPAFNAANKALELDPNLGEARATLGFLKMFHEWKWQEAENEFKKSIELNAGYATAHHWYAELLAMEGRQQEAKAEMRRALEINPLSHNFLADLGQIYYFSREYKQAEEYCRQALEIYPDFGSAHNYLFYIYLKTGEYDKAVEEMLVADKIQMTFANLSAERQKEIEANLEAKRKTYQTDGIKKFVENRAIKSQDPNLSYLDAVVYAFLDEKEKTLDCLEKACAGRGFLSAFVKADPIFDSLREEPRYQEILRKMNL